MWPSDLGDPFSPFKKQNLKKKIDKNNTHISFIIHENNFIVTQ